MQGLLNELDLCRAGTLVAQFIIRTLKVKHMRGILYRLCHASPTVTCLAVLAGAGALSITGCSEVSEERAKTAYNNWATWEEGDGRNIAKYPVEYANFLERRVNEDLESLEANRITAARQITRFNIRKQEAEEKIVVGEGVLTELAEAYNGAEENDAWPVSYAGEARDQEWVESRMVGLHRDVEQQRQLLNTYTTGIRDLEAQIAEIRELKTLAERSLVEIQAEREILRTQQNQIDDGIRDRLNQAGADIRIVSDRSDGLQSLDDLVRQARTEVDDGEFRDVLGRYR